MKLFPILFIIGALLSLSACPHPTGSLPAALVEPDESLPTFDASKYAGDPRLQLIKDGETPLFGKFWREPNPGPKPWIGNAIPFNAVSAGWVFIIFDDNAVIGYIPSVDRTSTIESKRQVVTDGAKIKVDEQNKTNPDKLWDWFEVPMSYWKLVAKNDPKLGMGEAQAVLNDGTIVPSPPYTGGTPQYYPYVGVSKDKQEWESWKTDAAFQANEQNKWNTPYIHPVFGPDPPDDWDGWKEN